MSRRTSPVIPGFNLTLGYTLVYLSLLVLIPLGAMFLHASQMTWEQFLGVISEPRVLAALKLSFGTAFLAALANGLIGTLLAWVLVRYQFPGRKIIDAMVDLPFALPTAVAGIALTRLYAPNGLLGELAGKFDLKIAFTPIGITIALVFVTLPFVVRTIQPVLEDIPKEIEEAATCLGAKPWQVFRHILLPTLLPAWLTGFALAFARGVGEYGSVIFISGNIQNKTEILPFLIMVKLDQYDYAAATAIGVLMLVVSFVLLLLINLLQRKIAKNQGA
ncbi:sulfate ABC transporter permease [Thiopseudomonas alkaliphila]|uniref:Sulfate transport system permease protein CysT n=1 Tax=Thiopseudomonas alkaliphila TaxID=1697053 RepID=A0A0K1XCB7_9GAMM|nr:sulfate ABC transporter permease subunit CysT [Thiopseudomonas alkaliphila]AKX44317.1 sulfate ABC transporter permease [Thiopseudomonas alkaliphila]AKX49600.1 sulfate ABC transporter permease [Thiopseudomonas alkaliphila]AKX50338.1 sulfate ABC transporter permease [Thiopseudomonas alkaliphila]AKX54630.1 sulfate ABC transporter permease [Thiopseudomonas alkaliphila]AKX56671.1 sulfate ABC transporter permease [Thiopseudomonas alkaliphila]